MIYLDNAASTRLDPDVLARLVGLLADTYGNPGSLHAIGVEAHVCLDEARKAASVLLGCSPDSVVFTSGGSEGNSLAIRGVLSHLAMTGKTHILVSAVEHESVLRAAESAVGDGFLVDAIPVDSEGLVDMRALERMITPQTGLVSCMYVNNELGGVNDVNAIGALCRQYGVLYHMDCVQAAGFFPIRAADVCDFATVSAHKFHGPKGVGALYVRDKALLAPLIHGGVNQEWGLRGGTENVPSLSAMGLACEHAYARYADDLRLVSGHKQRFFIELQTRLRTLAPEQDVLVNGPPVIRPGAILNLRFPGIDAQTMVLALSNAGVCISAGSACLAHNSDPSHVLRAIGLSDNEARNSVRISFSSDSTELEVAAAADATAEAVASLACMRCVHGN